MIMEKTLTPQDALLAVQADEIKELKKKINLLRQETNSFLYSALVNAQKEMPIIPRESVSFGKQKFSSYSDIIKLSRPVLTKHGLSVTQLFKVVNGDEFLETVLCHTSGQCISSTIKMIPPANTEKLNQMDHLKEIGKTITFLRRYSYVAICGIASED